MLAEIKFDYYQKMTKQQVELFAEHVDKDFAKALEKEQDEKGLYPIESWSSYVVDTTWLAKNLPGVEYTVRRTFKSENDLVSMLDKFHEMADRMDRMPFMREQDFNAKVNVHVPNLGLLLMDEVKVAEDYCTEALQDELDSGWRILAICPQPDQRRPDYILGRTKQR